MFGYGPRYLHSTGQLHKGGPNTGVFVLVTATPREDCRFPAQPFSFGTLELAQALGDFASLDATGRRALHVHLPLARSGAAERLADDAASRASDDPARTRVAVTGLSSTFEEKTACSSASSASARWA